MTRRELFGKVFASVGAIAGVSVAAATLPAVAAPVYGGVYTSHKWIPRSTADFRFSTFYEAWRESPIELLLEKLRSIPGVEKAEAFSRSDTRRISVRHRTSLGQDNVWAQISAARFEYQELP